LAVLRSIIFGGCRLHLPAGVVLLEVEGASRHEKKEQRPKYFGEQFIARTPPHGPGGVCMSGSDRSASASSTATESAVGVTASCARLRTWDACAGLLEAQSPLAKLDSKVVFGDDYPEPIRYDAERRLLRYRGFMSHATYVKLAALSDDREYQTALERLFVATSPPAVSPPWEAPWKGLAAAAIAVAVLAGGWYVWNDRPSPAAPTRPPENRVVTLKPEARTEIATQIPDGTTARPEGEARRPVER
jgi:hypothetical protein